MAMPSPTPVAPRLLFDLDGARRLLIGADGRMVTLDEDLEVAGEIARPFPTPLTKAAMIGSKLIGGWVDPEILVARLAAIDVEAGLEDGLDRADLRRMTNSRGEQPEVAGSDWSHVLDAEPLAVCAVGGLIVFVLWKRGVYAIEPDSAEIWRSAQPSWPQQEGLPRSDEVVTITEIGDDCVIWGRGGGWSRQSMSDGSIVSTGVIGEAGPLSAVYHHPDGGWLLMSSDGHLVRCDELGDEPRVARLKGAAGDAAWDEEEDCWRFTGWRQDGSWGTDVRHSPRADLGVALTRRGEDWLVLDNRGNWSPHLGREDRSLIG